MNGVTESTRGGRLWRPSRPLTDTAVVIAICAVMTALAMTPSLLPRVWTFQAYVSGISGVIGYGIGVLLAWAFRLTPARRWSTTAVQRLLPVRVRRLGWPLLLAAVPIALLAGLVQASDWQRQVRVLVGLPEESSAGWLRAMPVILLVAAVILAFFRGLRMLVGALTRLLRRWRLLGSRMSSSSSARPGSTGRRRRTSCGSQASSSTGSARRPSPRRR